MSQDLPPLDPITLSGFTFNPAWFLHKEYTDIGEAAVELPAVIEWVNEQLQVMVEKKIICKAAIKRVEAQEFNRLRGGDYLDEYVGKMTDSALNAAVQVSEKVARAHEDFAIYSGWYSRLHNLISVLEAKLDLVRSVEATRRKFVSDDEEEENQ